MTPSLLERSDTVAAVDLDRADGRSSCDSSVAANCDRNGTRHSTAQLCDIGVVNCEGVLG